MNVSGFQLSIKVKGNYFINFILRPGEVTSYIDISVDKVENILYEGLKSSENDDI